MITSSNPIPARRSFEVEGLGHGDNPIPAAARIGPLLVTGSVSGKDPVTRVVPQSLADEIEQTFDNLVAVLAAGGATLDDVAKVTVYIRDRSDRTALNAAWVQRFPDPGSRPVRHTIQSEIPSSYRLQVEALVYLTDTD